MNKREAALQFIRDNSRALHESHLGDAKVEYRAVNGHGFFLMEHSKGNGWTAFWPTTKNNVDVEMQKFEELSGEKFENKKDDQP